MKKLFEKQLSENLPLTKEILEQLKNKTYFNGENIQVGDVVLHALLKGNEVTFKNGSVELPLTVILLNERHFDMFTYEERYENYQPPVISLKNINNGLILKKEHKTFNDTYNGQNSELCKLLFDDLIEPKITKTDNEILDFWGRTLGFLNGVDDKLKIKMAYSFEEAAHILLTYQLGSDRFNEYIFPLIRRIISLNKNSYNINKLLEFCQEYVPVIDGKCFNPITSQLQCSEFYKNEVLILELMAKKYVELNKK